jgi:5-formyltetrahydrofolate cyclo-ligase
MIFDSPALKQIWPLSFSRPGAPTTLRLGGKLGLVAALAAAIALRAGMSTGSAHSGTLLAAVKTALRAEVKARMGLLTGDVVSTRSEALSQSLLSSGLFAESTAVCCFLSMPNGEVQTGSIIKACFDAKKRLFVPKVTGKTAKDLIMFEVESEAQLLGFPRSKWGIPEPPLDLVRASADGTDLGIIDLVILPGVAFDSNCNRLGHGKGYYDCFVERLLANNAKLAGPRPTLLAVGFDEQIIEGSIPVESHDIPVDHVVTPTRLISSR